ncbi:MAG: helix-turn-helix transcriptional regulator [Acidimicrobiales bacterium]
MSARTTANERVRRLLAVVPWIAARDGPTVDEVCARFGLRRSELLADLEVVWMVGLHPFTPDELVEVVIEDDRVWIHYAEFFARPQRLAPEQALALLAAGATALAAPDAEPAGPLASGLAKLAAVLGVDAEHAVAVRLGPAPQDVMELMHRAIALHRRVELDYYTYGRDDRATRVVDPYRVYSAQSEWYLAGHCHRAGALRVFRLDRIRRAELLDSSFEPPAELPELGAYESSDTDPRVVLRVAAAARWVIEQYPHERVVELEDGAFELTLPVSAPAWLERLLLRLGPHAQVVRADPPLDPAAGASAARRILARLDEQR